jgi:MFS family permease
MDYRLLARSPFLAANAYNFLFGAVTMGFYSFIPYYAVVKFGLTPFASAAVLTPRALVVVLTSTLASLSVKRLGYRMPMLVGMLLIGLMFILLAQGWSRVAFGPVSLDGFWLLAGIIAIGGLGMGLANPASANAALDRAPDKTASISGIRGTFRLAGGTISISCVVLGLSFFSDQARGLDVIFLVFTGILLLTVPLVMLVPEATPSPRARPVAAPLPAPADTRIAVSSPVQPGAGQPALARPTRECGSG